jgi:hypothetical protein
MTVLTERLSPEEARREVEMIQGRGLGRSKQSISASAKKSRRSKFNAVKRIIGGLRFDSIGESNRWLILKDDERKGKISNLRRQVPFPLMAWSEVGFVQIGTYKADFVYDRDGVEVIEDFKGCITAEFRRTQKIFKANYGKDILVTRK